MAVKTANRVSIFDRVGGQPVKTQVCTYWLAGRCKRNPCRFMHRESPPPQSHEIQSAPPKDIRGMQSKKMTWRRPNYYNPKTANISSNEGGLYSSTCGQSSRQKVLANTGKENDHIDQEITIASSDIHSDIEAQPKQCKYWVTGNCVHETSARICTLGSLAITGISLPSGSDKLYSCSKDKSIRAWDSHMAWKLQTEAEFSFGLLPGLVCSMVLDDDKFCWDGGSNNRLYSGSRDGTIRGFIALCGIHDAEDKPILLCSCNDNTVRLYDLPSFTERGRIFSKREVE
ncbi:UNVERIFIED_CONTAM: Zinc finger CCCH domain-containing protein 48 [Sesamum latifolium]|uniref:Zinc finger CCCH domain-containing protein 48 n=1 Tax=Sesamum latifolium TaxID=2727402 RepID=A0AAW2XXU6_9LAMI